MTESIFKTLVVLAIIAVLFYLIFSPTRNYFMEGLENQNPTRELNGEAASAYDYAKTIKNESTKLQDSLLISKYRKNYENAIINLEELISFTMLKTTLNINIDPDNLSQSVKNLEALNTLNNAKINLNSVMKFMDSQH